MWEETGMNEKGGKLEGWEGMRKNGRDGNE